MINRGTRHAEPGFRPDGSSQNWRIARVNGYGAWFGPPRSSGLGLRTVLEPNWTVFLVQTWTADGLPGAIANTQVNCHQIELIIDIYCYSDVWIIFAPLEGCLYILAAVILVLHSFLAHYFEPSIVCIFSFPVDIPLWQSGKHPKATNDVFYILWH